MCVEIAINYQGQLAGNISQNSLLWLSNDMKRETFIEGKEKMNSSLIINGMTKEII
jgi:hypothetical protein